MSNRIAKQLLAKIQAEMGQNINDVKKQLIEWLERPETGNVSAFCGHLNQINGALVLLEKNDAVSFVINLINAIKIADEGISKNSISPEKFDVIGVEIAAAFLLLSDYIDNMHLDASTDKLIEVSEILSDIITSDKRIVLEPKADSETISILSKHINEIIASDRNQIENVLVQKNKINVELLAEHNKELTNIFNILNFKDQLLFLEARKNILESKEISEKQWSELAELLILSEESLKSSKAKTNFGDINKAIQYESENVREELKSQLVIKLGETGLKSFEDFRKILNNKEKLEANYPWTKLAVDSYNYAGIFSFINQKEVSKSLLNFAFILNELAKQSEYKEEAYGYVVHSLVGFENVFLKLSAEEYPNQREIEYLDSYNNELIKLYPISEQGSSALLEAVSSIQSQSVEEEIPADDKTVSPTPVQPTGDLTSLLGDLDILDRDFATEEVKVEPQAVEPEPLPEITEPEPTVAEPTKSAEPVVENKPQTEEGTSSRGLPKSGQTTIGDNQVPSSEIGLNAEMGGQKTQVGSSTAPSFTPDTLDISEIDKLAPTMAEPETPAPASSSAPANFSSFFDSKAISDYSNFQVPESKQKFTEANAAAVDDPEVKEIFIEELQGVLEEINGYLPDWKSDISNNELLLNVRRGFHTIKGSGRMVGFESLGECAWQHESLLNGVRDSLFTANHAMSLIVEDTVKLFQSLLVNGDFSEEKGILLTQAEVCEKFLNFLKENNSASEGEIEAYLASLYAQAYGGGVGEVKAEQTTQTTISDIKPEIAPEIKAETTISDIKPETTPEIKTETTISDIKAETAPEIKAETTIPDIKTEIAPEIKAETTISDIKAETAPEIKAETTISDIKAETAPEIKAESQADEIKFETPISSATPDLSAQVADNSVPAENSIDFKLTEAKSDIPSETSISASAGFNPEPEIKHPDGLEFLLDESERPAPEIPEDGHDEIVSPAGNEIEFTLDTSQIVEDLKAEEQKEIEEESDFSADISRSIKEGSKRARQQFFRDKTLADLDTLSVPEDKVSISLADEGVEVDEEIKSIFLEELNQKIDEIDEIMPRWRTEEDKEEDTQTIQRAFHTIKGSGRSAGYQSLGEFAWRHEQLLQGITDKSFDLNEVIQDTIEDSLDLLKVLRDADEFTEHKAALLTQASVAEKICESLVANPSIHSDDLTKIAYSVYEKSATAAQKQGEIEKTPKTEFEDDIPTISDNRPSSRDIAKAIDANLGGDFSVGADVVPDTSLNLSAQVQTEPSLDNVEAGAVQIASKADLAGSDSLASFDEMQIVDNQGLESNLNEGFINLGSELVSDSQGQNSVSSAGSVGLEIDNNLAEMGADISAQVGVNENLATSELENNLNASANLGLDTAISDNAGQEIDISATPSFSEKMGGGEVNLSAEAEIDLSSALGEENKSDISFTANAGVSEFSAPKPRFEDEKLPEQTIDLSAEVSEYPSGGGFAQTSVSASVSKLNSEIDTSKDPAMVINPTTQKAKADTKQVESPDDFFFDLPDEPTAPLSFENVSDEALEKLASKLQGIVKEAKSSPYELPKDEREILNKLMTDKVEQEMPNLSPEYLDILAQKVAANIAGVNKNQVLNMLGAGEEQDQAPVVQQVVQAPAGEGVNLDNAQVVQQVVSDTHFPVNPQIVAMPVFKTTSSMLKQFAIMPVDDDEIEILSHTLKNQLSNAGIDTNSQESLQPFYENLVEQASEAEKELLPKIFNSFNPNFLIPPVAFPLNAEEAQSFNTHSIDDDFLDLNFDATQTVPEAFAMEQEVQEFNAIDLDGGVNVNLGGRASVAGANSPTVNIVDDLAGEVQEGDNSFQASSDSAQIASRITSELNAIESSDISINIPNITISSSALADHLSQELSNITATQTISGSASADDEELEASNEKKLLSSIDRFDALVNEIHHEEKHDLIDDLIDSVYEIEDSLDSNNTPNWVWRLLDGVEQLLLIHKQLEKPISSKTAQTLRQGIELIEHINDISEDESSSIINSLMLVRQELISGSEDKSSVDAKHEESIATIKDIYEQIETKSSSDALEADSNAGSEAVEIFIDEASVLINRSQIEAEQWGRNRSQITMLDTIRRDMHTLKGSARMTGYESIGDFTHTIESVLESLIDGKTESNDKAVELLTDLLNYEMTMLETVRDGYIPKIDKAIMQRIQEFLQTGSSERAIADIDDVSVKAPEEAQKEEFVSDKPKSPIDDITAQFEKLQQESKFQAEQEVAPSKEEMAKAQENNNLGLDIDPALLEIFTDEARDLVDKAGVLLAGKLEGEDVLELKRAMHTIKGSARMVGFTQIGDTSHNMESIIDLFADYDDKKKSQAKELLDIGHEAISSMVDSVLRNEMPSAATSLNNSLEKFAKDGIFELPSMEDDKAAKSSAKAEEEKKADDKVLDLTGDKKAEDKKEAQPEVRRYVRVDAKLLDEMITMIGEFAIVRSRMENISNQSEFNLSELTRIATRIDEQMRRLDNETEAQMKSRHKAQEDDDESFDPLEMDRFNEIQQLSRQLSESINDLKNIQDTLTSENALIRQLSGQQNVLQRGIQDRLLTTQLMRFDTNSNRLKRLVSQTAKSVGKEINFILDGGHVELERSLIEDILPALEHIIRNSVDHGIEDRETRIASGKAPEGTIKLTVLANASNVEIRVLDDGKGFDYDRIREKARAKGWLDPSKENDVQYLNSLLLRSGFSTAKTVTQLSGRGVGMDVVNETIKQRRGQLRADSIPGKGTQFTIILPFSMSIAEVLLVEVAKQNYIVSMSSISAVNQIDSDILRRSYQGGELYYHYDNMDYRLYILGSYFRPNDYEFNLETATAPVIFVNSGGEPVAFFVDKISNRLEVIVKNVNKQVLNIPGISGATVLGDGSVVPVLDLLDLARKISNLDKDIEIDEVEELQPHRILVVDDSVTMRKVSSRLLERNGYVVETAKDGLDAIDVLQKFTPDMILLDIEMPRMDGFEFASYVRQESNVKEVPIVMITSRTGDKHRERADQIGVQGYLGKPYREDQLIDTIHALIGENNG